MVLRRGCKQNVKILQALNASFERYQEERRSQGLAEHQALIGA